MQEMIRHKIVSGLADHVILQDVLVSDFKSLEEMVMFVEGRESGKNGLQLLAGTNVRELDSQPTGRNIGGKSGATLLQCSQKFFEDLGFDRKFLGLTLLDLSLAMSPRSDIQFRAETFCL